MGIEAVQRNECLKVPPTYPSIKIISTLRNYPPSFLPVLIIVYMSRQ